MITKLHSWSFDPVVKMDKRINFSLIKDTRVMRHVHETTKI